VDWNTLASAGIGVGTLAVAFAAYRLGRQANQLAREGRRATVRERTSQRLAALIAVTERDLLAYETQGVLVRSPDGAAACSVLWGNRNIFGTTWAYYCEPEQRAWIDDLDASGELAMRMRSELREALNSLDFEDVRPDPTRPRLIDRALNRLGLRRIKAG
jgi:hypothetical protein